MRRMFGSAVAAALFLAVCAIGLVDAGFNNNGGFNNNAVGGVAVDASGVLKNATSIDDSGRLREARRALMKDVPADLAKKTELRKVSLRRLEAELAKHLKAGTPLPDEIRYVAGLTKIQYVFLYPEQNDIVLAGPADAWTLDRAGNVVGKESGRPVLFLDDLLVALRTLSGNVRQPITCSIDPTQEGMARLQTLLKSQAGQIGGNPAGTLDAIEKALGPQKITFQGVDPTSHFARVLVSADYRMKRLAMGFEPSPVPQMPSFLQMASAGTGNMMPRWWMAPHYDTILAAPEGDAWELKGSGVKVMTEDAFFAADGKRELTGKQNPKAVQWADTMTNKFQDLAVKMPIFGELNNAMDAAVVAALIVKEDLFTKADFAPGVLTDSALPTAAFDAPSATPTQVSHLKSGKTWVITASGGVDLNPWSIVEKVKTEVALKDVRSKQAGEETNSKWWWN